jgi:hypothetical protein
MNSMKRMKLGAVTLIMLIISLILAGLVLFLVFRGDEDNWIKNTNGVYIKHGNPSKSPSYVLEQQDALTCASDLYSQAKSDNIAFNSQCLGACGNYSVDIVHVPRSIEDDKASNQCIDYPRVTPYFIELDKNGVVVRVA